MERKTAPPKKVRKAAPKPVRPLTPRQTRFVQEYLVDLNATSAAERAGYSDRSIGRHLITLPHVVVEVQKALTARAQRTEVTADWVVQRLALEAARTGEGSQHSARVKALELLSRHLGVLPADQHWHTHAAPASPQTVAVATQTLLEALPMETLLQLRATMREVAERKALPAPAQAGDVIPTTATPPEATATPPDPETGNVSVR
jgi:hypothetical protein